MLGEKIALVRYMEGHSDLGDQQQFVELFGSPTSLTVRKVSDSVLFSIPWGNFSSAQDAPKWKNGVSMWGAIVMRSIPVLNITNAASSFHDGFWLSYWDEEIERSQSVYFSTGSERKAKQIVQIIYRFRDQYHRNIGSASKPAVREKSQPTALIEANSTTQRASRSAPKKASKPSTRKVNKPSSRKPAKPLTKKKNVGKASKSAAKKTSKPATRKVTSPKGGKKR